MAVKSLSELFEQRLEWAEGGRPDPRGLPAQGGVYAIADESDRPILLAMGENLRRVVVNRLTAPLPAHKSKRADLSKVARRVYWRPTFSRFETAWAHWQASRAIDPTGYRNNLAFGPAWFLSIDLGQRTPRLEVTCEPRFREVRAIGPFASRRDAEEWLRMLEDVFDLCRYHDILQQAPHGAACTYFDIGKCPAPCNGSISLEVYHDMLADALRFSTGDYQPRLTVLNERMRTTAQGLQFEKAAAIRQTMDRARDMVAKSRYRHVTDLASCSWLIVQRGGPPRRGERATVVKPFFVRCGTIEVGRPTALAGIEEAVPQWLGLCGSTPVSPPKSAEEQTSRCEALWLAAKLLFQEERAPGLFYRFDQLPEPAALVEAIQRRFGRAAQARLTRPAFPTGD